MVEVSGYRRGWGVEMSQIYIVAYSHPETTKSFELAAPGDEGPVGWTKPNFDDSEWDNAVAIYSYPSPVAPIEGAVTVCHNTTKSNTTYLFRTVFNVSSHYQYAFLYYNVDDYLTLYVNGMYVDGTVDDFKEVYSIDITDFIHSGLNVIAARVRNRLQAAPDNIVLWQCRLDLIKPDLFIWSKVNGKWEANSVSVKINGIWETVIEGWVKDGGAWRPCMGQNIGEGKGCK